MIIYIYLRANEFIQPHINNQLFEKELKKNLYVKQNLNRTKQMQRGNIREY